MSEIRFRNEIAQLGTLRSLLAADTQLPLRLELTPRSLTWREFILGIHGISSLVVDGSRWTSATSFSLSVQIPGTYPDQIPFLKFLRPVPFHPHVWASSGEICWGSLNRPRKDLMLLDWIRGIVDYLQYGQDADILINRDSPANRDALNWFLANKSRLRDYVPRIDMARLRFWIEQARV